MHVYRIHICFEYIHKYSTVNCYINNNYVLKSRPLYYYYYYCSSVLIGQKIIIILVILNKFLKLS